MGCALQNIGEDLLELLGESRVRNIFIVQNKYTENGRSVNYQYWKRCRRSNPRLRFVNLSISETISYLTKLN